MKKSALIGMGLVVIVIGRVMRQGYATAAREPVGSRGKAGCPGAGEAAPELTLKDLDGKDPDLTQFKGKVVLVNFSATWSEPCKVEITELIELQPKYRKKGFTVLGVAMDDEGSNVVAPFVGKERFDVNGGQSRMNYPIVIGDDAAADK